MEPKTIREIDAAAEAYVDARDGRMALGREEVEKATILLELMRRHGLTAYEFDDKVVTVASLTKVRVAKAKHEENGEAGE